MTSELLRQVRVVDPISQTDRVADVLLMEGVVTTIAPTIVDVPEQTWVSDRPHLVLGPGLVDLYSHSGEPGFEPRETLVSLMQAAAAGGFTRLHLLPDTDPPLDHPGTVAGLYQAIAQSLTADAPLPVQVKAWGALTQRIAGEQMTELAELAPVVVGFADGRPLPHLGMVQRILDYAQPLAKPIALYACDPKLARNGVVREGLTSLQLGLPGSPAIAESAALAALLECVELTGSPVHLMRLSTARGVELVQAGKARGLPITASTSWMHLLWDVTHVASYDPNLHLDPPLGTPADRAALIRGIYQGVIDAIAIDHTPYTYEEKTVAFAEAPPGAIGLELALPLLWQALVVPGHLDALTLWSCLSTNPALCVQQNPPTLTPGAPAELCLFDPTSVWQVDSTNLRSRSHNTPWFGQSVQGRVIRTWATGRR